MAALFTVILPTRNEAHNILPFLTSVPPEIPLIAVDAGTDETAQIIRDRRLNAQVFQEQTNIPEARQLGAHRADSEWLVFSDADVSFAEGYFDVAAELIKSDADALYGVKYAADVQYDTFYRQFSRWQARFDRWGIPAVSGSNLLVKRTTFLKTDGFDPALTVNEDTEFGYRLKRLGYQIRFSDRLKVLARDHRRLEKGTWRKNIHTLARCSLLYSGLMPERWKSADWGYWD